MAAVNAARTGSHFGDTPRSWTGTHGPMAGPAGSAPALAPPWAAPVAVVALLVGTLLAGLVWHATRLNAVDAWVMRRQELAFSHAHGVAETVSGVLPAGVTLMIMVAGAAVAWLAGRRDAVALALTAAPATLATELLLKRLVHRQWNGDPNGDPALIFPSGHVAVATAAAMTAVLVLRVMPVAPSARGPPPSWAAASCWWSPWRAWWRPCTH